MEENRTDNRKTQLARAREIRTWSQVARLAGDAITALDAGRPKDARGILTAIRGVALNADQEGV